MGRSPCIFNGAKRKLLARERERERERERDIEQFFATESLYRPRAFLKNTSKQTLPHESTDSIAELVVFCEAPRG